MTDNKLFKHITYIHNPNNPNILHEAEKQAAGFNQKIALLLTRGVGTMICAYLFAVLAIIGFPYGVATPTQYVQWLSQTFIQLVMLSVIMVGQSVLGRKQELQSNEQYDFVIKTYHDIEQVVDHLNAQDAELLKQTFLIKELLQGKTAEVEA